MAGTSLVVQWLRLHTPNAGGPGSIPGQGTRSHTHAATKNSHATTKEPALPQLKSPPATTKTQHNQNKKKNLNISAKKRKKREESILESKQWEYKRR